ACAAERSLRLARRFHWPLVCRETQFCGAAPTGESARFSQWLLVAAVGRLCCGIHRDQSPPIGFLSASRRRSLSLAFAYSLSGIVRDSGGDYRRLAATGARW